MLYSGCTDHPEELPLLLAPSLPEGGLQLLQLAGQEAGGRQEGAEDTPGGGGGGGWHLEYSFARLSTVSCGQHCRGSLPSRTRALYSRVQLVRCSAVNSSTVPCIPQQYGAV